MATRMVFMTRPGEPRLAVDRVRFENYHQVLGWVYDGDVPDDDPLAALHDTDAERETFIPARLSQTALEAALARPVAGNRIVLLGNSRIDREKYVSGTTRQTSSLGAFTWANARIGSRFTVVASVGVSGDRQSQMIARWATDVTPYASEWLLLADPVNDATDGKTAAQMIADTQILLGLAKAEGRRVILLTAPPSNSHTTGQRQALHDWNRWVTQTTDPRVVPVDVATCVTDPTTGNYAAAYTADGLHQNQAGASRMAQVLAPVLSALLPARNWFPPGPGDTANAIANPWAAGTPAAGSFPSPWNFTGSATIATVARTDLVPGNWLQTTTAAPASVNVKQTIAALPSGWAAGNTVRMLFEVQADAGLAGAQFLDGNFQLQDAGSAVLATGGVMGGTLVGTFPAADVPVAPSTLVFESLPVAIPAGAAKIVVNGHFFAQGVLRYGRFALLRNI